MSDVMETKLKTALADVANGTHECPVCLEDIDELHVLIPCMHKYCKTCVEKWTATNYVHNGAISCPLCKREYVEIIHSIKSDSDFITVPVETMIQKDELVRELHMSLIRDIHDLRNMTNDIFSGALRRLFNGIMGDILSRL